MQTIAQQFQDVNLQKAIAAWMGKTVNDTITKEEIDSKLAQSGGELNLSKTKISSMSGFEIFNGPNLIKLFVDNNQLTTLDVRGLTGLTRLDANANHLTSLYVSGLMSLEYLNANANQLTTLDVRGTGLTRLDANYNQLMSLDVSDCTSLQFLYASHNPLTRADVVGFAALNLLSTDL